MKRLLLSLVLTISTMLSTVWAYDFSVVVSSGQTLYFNINQNTVSVTYPGLSSSSPYNGYTKPTGNLVIPATVTRNGTTYSVTSIGSLAFYNCSGLTSVTIPNSVTSIGYYAFYQSNLDSIEIPNSVTYIREYAFYECDYLASINIPNSVTFIGEYAFYHCDDLTSVTIGNHVNSIGVRAFADCRSLRTLNYNTINCSYYLNYGDDLSNYNHSILFSGSRISTINIGDSVQRIPDFFARDLESLITLTIGNNVTSIGKSAFSGCSNLTYVTIPNSVTSIGERAFSSVRHIFYNGTATGSPWGALNVNGYVDGDFVYFDSTKTKLTLYIGTDTNVTIPNSVTSIGEYAFYYCTDLASVTIPNSVTSIGEYAFCYCTGLTSVTIGNSVTSIGSSAFQGCSGLTSVTIPNNVTSIGNAAFRNCSGLTTLNFNAINCNYSNFYYLSDHPFYNSPITTINIGDSVQRIPVYFACNLESLTSVTIPNSVTSIGNSAFNGCSGLTSVTIGNSVTSIGIYAFSGCTNLRDVTSLAVTPPTLGTTVFSAAGILKVPCGSLSAYRYSAWLDYFTIMEEICDNMTITVTSANESMGTVSGGGEYEFGTVATITATPNEGYRFVSWNDGNTNNPRTITVTGNATYIATFEEGVGIENIDVLDNLTFYPNPTKGILNFSREVEKIEVMDMMGKMVMQFCNANEINIASLPKGVYCLKLSYNDKATVHKIIKE